MDMASCVNSCSILIFSFALTSMNVHLQSSASILPSSESTFLSSLRSHLLPIISFGSLLAPFCSNCIIQLEISSKDLRSLMPYTIMIPDAPLKYVSVNVLNLSCPAVSHNCNLILFLWLLFLRGTSMILERKSTPMVGVCTKEQFSLMNLRRMLVFPTAELPIITIFARQSQSVSLFFVSWRLSFYISAEICLGKYYISLYWAWDQGKRLKSVTIMGKKKYGG